MISHTALRQSFLIALILGLSLLLFTNLYFIIDALLGSMILGILSVKPIHFMVRRKIKRTHAELIYFTVALLGVVVPLTILFFVLKGQWSSIFHFLQGYGQSLEIIGQKLNEKLGINFINEDVIKSTAIKISSFVPKLLNSTLDLLTTIGVMYFLLYFFIKEGTSIRSGLLSILPLKDSNRDSIYSLTYQSVLSNTLMMPLVALFQGLIAWVGYALAGVSHSFIWFVATFLASMIPFFGAALIYIPLGILLFFKGQQGAGVFVMIWGFAAVSSADNFLRIFFMKKFDNTHPLITFLGVMAGLNIFGFLGIIFGPLLISLLLILIRIYREEYK
ncbi:MAG: AI-2E family transporter [Chitinophagales bacterium]|jgi:predicted PurR-regulated permease PerM|nr:AI-2E family transporter [Sphingobacteriales bacterium]